MLPEILPSRCLRRIKLAKIACSRSSKSFEVRLDDEVEYNHLKSWKIHIANHPADPLCFVTGVCVFNKSFTEKHLSQREVR